jgi:hypothetical protein
MGYNPKPMHTSGVETEGVDGNGYEIALYLFFEQGQMKKPGNNPCNR